MEGTRLRFPGSGGDYPLSIGVHGIVRRNDDTLEVVDGAATGVRLCVDRRGIWLTVEGESGVHVNGRPIRRMAMLRVGDAIYIDGIEVWLLGARRPEAPPALSDPVESVDDPRIVLRGIGGRHHGRSFTLERPKLVGRNLAADIRIDAPAFADRHARFELSGDHVVLRDLGSAEGSLVNGEPVRDAILHAGDQVVFDGHHRFVVEAPRRALPAMPGIATGHDEDDVDMAAEDASGPSWRLPWLLLAALLMAVLLGALLLFGAG
jgi:pSer/pThr/pTyr-binding forkhead associated (FHA) protein